MKASRIAVASAFLTLTPLIAVGQTTSAPSPPVVRADATASLGWFNARETATPDDTQWYNRSAIGTGLAGWYWTDNLKTEVEAGASTRATLFGYRSEFEPPYQIVYSVHTAHSTRRVAASQLYQFFRNRWFHPFLGAGIDVAWRKRRSEDAYVSYYVPATGQSRSEEEEALPATTDVEARPFAVLGYKAYMTPRVFFRNDLRMTFGGGIDELMLRFGIGVDLAPGKRQ